GDGPERARIEKIVAPNVRLLGRLSDADRDAWLARARAFVFAAEEDFGIAPLEAQAHGTPVIAFARGGSVETLRGLDTPEPSGVFFLDQTADAIAQAVLEFESHADRITPEACRANAERFAAARFRTELAAFVENRWLAFNSRAGAREA